MALKFFDEESSSDNLPWIDKFIDSNPDIEEDYCSPVRRLIQTNKGWLVVTRDYKGFLFKDSKIVSFLEEAISYWRHDPKNTVGLPGIFLTCEQKPRLAFDDSFKNVSITFETKTKLLINWDTGTKSLKKQSSTVPINPFLAKQKDESSN
jgi:hypothetical protein